MPCKGRINVPGLTHHIMVRTFCDLALFRNDADRRVYLSYFAKRIHETGFSSDYAHYYNRRYKRRGSDARKVFCYFASLLGFPTFETGRFLGIGQAGVSNATGKRKTIAGEKKISWPIVKYLTPSPIPDSDSPRFSRFPIP